MPLVFDLENPEQATEVSASPPAGRALPAIWTWARTEWFRAVASQLGSDLLRSAGAWRRAADRGESQRLVPGLKIQTHFSTQKREERMSAGFGGNFGLDYAVLRGHLCYRLTSDRVSFRDPWRLGVLGSEGAEVPAPAQPQGSPDWVASPLLGLLG